MFRRLHLVAAGALALLLALTLLPTSASATSDRSSSKYKSKYFPTEFALPTGFLPEGIAIGALPFAFFGSRADGDIYRVNLITGEGKVFSQGPGTPSVGLKVDQRGRLFVAGGNAGNARVVNAVTGEIIASYSFVTPPAPTFINDVIVTRDGAYFTDSNNPVIYKLPFGRFGQLPSAAEVERIPLSGDYQQGPGTNANGIAQTPDGRGLIIVQSPTGFLFRVDPATGVAKRIDLGGATVVNGDGLLLSGQTLFVVRNRDNLVAVLRLNNSGTTGKVVQELRDPRFDVPTTIAEYGNRLYLPNARFGIANPTTVPYNAVAIPRP